MGKIIASSYELLQEIGSGGGGIVYLGRHLRLNKQIVLKAYRRTGAVRSSYLSREVDALKDLSHTYIPQVYDYVEEDGVIYSVMDYIAGESLDKPLKRGERFSQPEVIQWARQLLEALVYLHSRPPHGILHSDIKPANIMLTPQGDIRLIDFNIALALGEEGAVRVGFSRGYASPEHYGISYAPPPLEDPAKTQMDAKTQFKTSPETVLSKGSSTTGGAVLLDVRSDIYSLGATLYHILTGRKPASNAKEVSSIPLGEASPAVAAIIQKAMAADPADRWQTAAEMLQAFERLHQDDPRTKQHKRRAAVTAGVLAALFLTGGVCTFTGLKQMEQAQERERIAAELSERSLSAVTASEAAYRAGDIPKALRMALEALELDSAHAPKAQKTLTDALGVYDLSESFQPYRSLPLPSAPIKTALSPAGSRTAVMVSGQLLTFDTASGEQLAAFPVEASALSDVVFAGEDTILYAGEGALRAYDLLAGENLWDGNHATAIALSEDNMTAAAVYRDESLATIYDVRTGEVLQTVSFGGKHQYVIANDVFADPEDHLLALSGDGRYLAVSFSDGSLDVYDLRNREMDITLFDASDYTHFEGGFFGPYFAFSAAGETESVFAVIDVEAAEQTGGFFDTRPFHVRADGSGILVSTENLLVELHPVTGEQKELAYASADITGFARNGSYTLVSLADGTMAVYDENAELLETWEEICDFLALSGDYALTGNRDTPSVRILRLEEHPADFTYDRSYLHDEARMGENVILYRYDGFRILDPDGSVLADAAIPDSANVYDQQYRRKESGDYLEVFYNDGTVRAYSAEDGRLLAETRGPEPDWSLAQEFLTDRLRITAPLHSAATAYDRETGELVRELERDDYLTYATQVGEYVVTEYITSQGERYGLLLDGECETLARLPGLCDILPDGTLLFDDLRGNLRKSPVYSLEELMALAAAREADVEPSGSEGPVLE